MFLPENDQGERLDGVCCDFVKGETSVKPLDGLPAWVSRLKVGHFGKTPNHLLFLDFQEISEGISHCESSVSQ